MQKNCNVQLLSIRKENALRKAAIWGVNHENTSMMVTMRNNFTSEKIKVCRLFCGSNNMFTHIVWPQKTSQSFLTTLYSKWLYDAWLCVSWLLAWGAWILFPVVLHETWEKDYIFHKLPTWFQKVLKNMSSGEEYPQPSWCSGLLFAFWPLD